MCQCLQEQRKKRHLGGRNLCHYVPTSARAVGAPTRETRGSSCAPRELSHPADHRLSSPGAMNVRPCVLVWYLVLVTACAARSAPERGWKERDPLLIAKAELWEGRAYVIASAEVGRGARFALLDLHTKGYQGTVRVLGPSRYRECDDCGNTRFYDAERVGGVIPRSAVAVGPVSAPLPRARITYVRKSYTALHELPLDQTATGWMADVQIDLDGAGGFDVESVIRCAHSVQASCRHRVCNRSCTGTRWAGHAEPEPRTVDCVDLVPDVPDRCPEDPEDPGLRECSQCPAP
jgi:hypothetical protein